MKKSFLYMFFSFHFLNMYSQICDHHIAMYKQFLPLAYNRMTRQLYFLGKKGHDSCALYTQRVGDEQEEQLCIPLIYTPSRISFFPDYSGFSFIQDDVLYIKLPLHRLAKALEFTEPIYQIGDVIWQDKENGIVVAKKGYTTGIFSLKDDGTVLPIQWCSDKDCYYPVKIDSDFFYIERRPNASGLWIYAVKKNHEQTIYEQTAPIGFLSAKDSERLFFITSLGQVALSDQKSTYVKFNCIELFLSRENIWETRTVFEFHIPLNLLQAYQENNITLLMPKLIEDSLFYTDYLNEKSCVLCKYSLYTQKSIVLSYGSNDYIQAHALVSDTIYPLFLT